MNAAQAAMARLSHAEITSRFYGLTYGVLTAEAKAEYAKTFDTLHGKSSRSRNARPMFFRAQETP